AADGLAGLPRMPVLSGGYLHPSDRKALQLLGHGRNSVEIHARDGAGRVDLVALDRRLAELAAPAVVIASAGEVDTGDFDPLADLAEPSRTCCSTTWCRARPSTGAPPSRPTARS
ncbi:hypothetical protein KBX37_17205, partial [Micromonospora sp. U56]|nr:hypothetical protein [Micromonospora sp. U56]